jgi:hypothetical protein
MWVAASRDILSCQGINDADLRGAAKNGVYINRFTIDSLKRRNHFERLQ